MSELLVIIFKEKHRASKIFYQIQHEGEKVIPNLLNAIVFIADENRRVTVEQRINLSSSESSGWSKFWGSFMGAAMLTPFFFDNTKFIDEIESSFGAPSVNTRRPLSRNWWSDELRVPASSIRDFGALLRPESSALLMVIDQAENMLFLDGEDFTGGDFIRVPLDDDQMNMIRRNFW